MISRNSGNCITIGSFKNFNTFENISNSRITGIFLLFGHLRILGHFKISVNSGILGISGIPGIPEFVLLIGHLQISGHFKISETQKFQE